MAFSKETIDRAAELYTSIPEGGWNKVAELLTQEGYTSISGGYIHGIPLCSEVINTPEYSHLRKHKAFSSEKRILIAKAIEAEGIDQETLTRIMKRLS